MICGITAALGMNQYLVPPTAPAAPKVETTMLPVAVVEIGRGDRITELTIQDREWPTALIPEGAIRSKEELIDKIAQSPIYPSEPFLSGKVGETERFSGLVKEGMRAYTILTPNDASLVAGLITPGDRVDVLFTDRNSKKEFTGGGSTTPLLQNIEVMAVGHDLSEKDVRSKEKKDMRSVTLAVTLDMATKLALAQQLGTLHLALRSEQDNSTADAGAITLNELMRTMYPALLEAEEKESKPEPVATEVAVEEPVAVEVLKPIQRKEIMVRTLRGFVPSDLMMTVSADGRHRVNEIGLKD